MSNVRHSAAYLLDHHMTYSEITLLEGKPAGPSSARLAAESAFSGITASETATSARPVIIVRRKKLPVDGEHDDRSPGDDRHHGATRDPKVYRVDSGQVEEPERSAAQAGVANASERGPSPGRDGGAVVSRRRRHRKHGGVTIVRPAPPSACELAERARVAKEQYERLRAEISELDRQIEAAREVEVGKAVRWIRQAIAEYGLEAKDLGFF